MQPSESLKTPSRRSSSLQSWQRRAERLLSLSVTMSRIVSPILGLMALGKHDSDRRSPSPKTKRWLRFRCRLLQTRSWSMQRGYSHNSRTQFRRCKLEGGPAPI